jgi:hypothetical protein
MNNPCVVWEFEYVDYWAVAIRWGGGGTLSWQLMVGRGKYHLARSTWGRDYLEQGKEWARNRIAAYRSGVMI